MSKVGFFGGSFDPIHLGHLNLALQIMELKGLDQVLFCPANVSPTKERRPPVAEAKHRLAMLQLALEDVPGCDPYDGEIKRPPPSYTIDTLKEVKGCTFRGCIPKERGVGVAGFVSNDDPIAAGAKGEESDAKDVVPTSDLLGIDQRNVHPRGELHLIVAEDTAYGFGEWKEIEALLEMAPPLVGVRHGFDKEKLNRLPASIQEKIQKGLCSIPAFDISSTVVRERLKKRLYCGHLVQGKVLDYIHQNTIY